MVNFYKKNEYNYEVIYKENIDLNEYLNKKCK
jgi:hypothetical protein